MLVCEHDDRVPDADLGVADLAAGPGIRMRSVAPNTRP
jgi:hypothetical protein